MTRGDQPAASRLNAINDFRTVYTDGLEANPMRPANKSAAPYELFPAVGMRDPALVPAPDMNRREALLDTLLESDFFQDRIADNRFMAVRVAGLTAAVIGIVIANPNNLKEWNS